MERGAVLYASRRGDNRNASNVRLYRSLVFFQTVRDEKVEQKEEEKGGEGVQIEGPF